MLPRSATIRRRCGRHRSTWSFIGSKIADDRSRMSAFVTTLEVTVPSCTSAIWIADPDGIHHVEAHRRYRERSSRPHLRPHIRTLAAQ
jgi:hypothetical protein